MTRAVGCGSREGLGVSPPSLAALALCDRCGRRPPIQAPAYVVQSSVDGSTLAARERRRAPADGEHHEADDGARRAASTRRSNEASPCRPPRPGSASRRSTCAPGQRLTVARPLHRRARPERERRGDGARDRRRRQPAALRRADEPEGARARARGRATGTRTASTRPGTSRAPGTSRSSCASRSASRSSAVRGSARAVLSDGRVVESTDNLIDAVPRLRRRQDGPHVDAGWSQVGSRGSAASRSPRPCSATPSEAQRDADLAALLRFGLGELPAVARRRSRPQVRDRGGRLGPRSGRVVAPRAIVRPAPLDGRSSSGSSSPPSPRFPSARVSGSGRWSCCDGRGSSRASRSSPARARDEPTRSQKAGWLARRTVHHLVGLVS